MRNRTEEAGAVCVRPLRSIIPSLALLFVVALAGSVLKVPAVAAVGDGSAQTLRVTVMDAAGNLLPGAMVAAIDAEGLNVKATERPDGVYVIEGVWAKTTLEVDHPSFVPGSFELTLPDQPMVQVEVILGKANPVAAIIEADKPVAPGGGGPGEADLSAQAPSILVTGDASGGILAAGGLCDGTEIPEDEPNCGLPTDTVNGGCNSLPPIFSPIACGDTYCGTAAWDGATRDTDWYEIITVENTEFTWTVTASFAFVIGYVPTVPLGSGDCATVSVLDPFAVGSAGEQISIITDCLPPGIHWFFVAPDFAGPTFLCGPDYVATLTCNVPCELPPGPCDDAAGDCCEANGTPGCDDPECCEIVCAIDPFCCDQNWDSICAGEAADLCGKLCFVPPPVNDLCEAAIPLEVPSFTLGTTDGATVDGAFPLCGTGINSPGVWYSVMGTGTTMTATTCTDFFDYDTKISVYCGTCEEPTCVDGNDDNCPDGASGLLSTVTWCSQVGAEYLILVHGFGGQSGDFELDVFDDGVNCKATVECLPQGACCLTGLTGECIVTTAQGCDAQGGVYQGDDTDCGGLVYPEFSDCANPFEDISDTGIEAPNASNNDDAGDIVPIGFTFNFYGDDHTDIGVTSNGYLTFGADLTDFTNDAIPNTNDPNDLIAPLWDDFNPGAAGTVHYETRGNAPNRRFIAQWTNVPQFANNDSNTFQAILFEGSNCIEFRYGEFTPEGFAGDYTIGIENQDGSDGESIPGADVFPGDCKVICQELVKSPCVPSCPADFDNSGAVDVKDLLFLLGAWGPCPKQGDCPADFDNSSAVDVKDLLFLLGAWGPCP